MVTTQQRISSMYYSEIARTPLVDDPEEERRLLRRWQQKRDVGARDAVVKTHLRFVVKLAHKRTKDPEAVKDYIAAGNVGLLKAADKFDWNRKPYIRFLTYAGWWIYEEISNQDYTSATLVHVPTHRQKTQRRQAREFRTAVQKHGPENASVQGMERGIPEGVVTTIEEARHTADTSETEPMTAYSAERLRTLIRDGISQLPPREQIVLSLYYGIKDDPRNLIQIASIMGVCTERIRQIKLNGIKHLQKALRTRAGLGDKSKLCDVEAAYL